MQRPQQRAAPPQPLSVPVPTPEGWLPGVFGPLYSATRFSKASELQSESRNRYESLYDTTKPLLGCAATAPIHAPSS